MPYMGKTLRGKELRSMPYMGKTIIGKVLRSMDHALYGARHGLHACRVGLNPTKFD